MIQSHHYRIYKFVYIFSIILYIFYIYYSELISVRNSTYFTQQLNQCNLILKSSQKLGLNKMHILKNIIFKGFFGSYPPFRPSAPKGKKLPIYAY
jgi:hypothetical protein